MVYAIRALYALHDGGFRQDRDREYERAMAFLALERHKNRDIPEIALPTSKEEYDKRMVDAQDSIRES